MSRYEEGPVGLYLASLWADEPGEVGRLARLIGSGKGTEDDSNEMLRLINEYLDREENML